MGLLIDPFYFADESENYAATPAAAASPGVAFTAGANDVDGAAVALLGALAHDVHYIELGIAGTGLSTADSSCLLDLLIDPAGGTSWSSLIDDLICGFLAVPTTIVGVNTWYRFPLFIKAGASLGIQAKTHHTADITSGRAVVVAKGNPNKPDLWWCGSKVESLGPGANSKGVTITTSTANVFSAWTSIGGPTSGRYGALQFGAQEMTGNVTNNSQYFQIGSGSVKLPGTPTIPRIEASSDVGLTYSHTIHCDIPAGTQLQSRMISNGSTQSRNVALYGVY